MAHESNTIISVQDYGPIAEAKNIELCPLTVFVGPSNTGKSYLATLVYALFKSWEPDYIFSERDPRRIIQPKEQPRTFSEIKSSNKELTDWLSMALKGDAEKFNLSGLPKVIKKWIDEEISKIINENFHGGVFRCLGMNKKNNNLMGKEFKFTLEDNLKKLELNSLNKASSLKIKQLSMESKKMERFPSYIIAVGGMPIDMQAEMLFGSIQNEILYPHGGGCFYLPAARTGIMQSHRAIAGTLVRRASFTGLEDVSIPTLSGIVSDFLQEIILMNTDSIPDIDVEKVAQSMEENVLHGSITQESLEKNTYPQFVYRQKDIEVPLLRASSMVSELAPVVLFLKHKVRKGDLIIIEEPESHLHPAAQREITKTIVQLVRAGVRVMITTHSDYILEQLSNHVRQSKLKDKREFFLDEKEIGAYSFTPKNKGTVVKRLEFTNENGLSPDDHDQVSSDLYNETVEILDKLDEEKK